MGFRVGGSVGPIRYSKGKGPGRVSVGGSVGPVSYSKTIHRGGTTRKVAPKRPQPRSSAENAVAAAGTVMLLGSLFTKKGRKDAAKSVKNAIVLFAVIVCLAVVGVLGGMVFLVALAMGGTLTEAFALAGVVALVVLVFVLVGSFTGDPKRARDTSADRLRR